MPSPLYEFLEVIADELMAQNPRIITPESLEARGRESSLFQDLRTLTKTTDNARAITLALDLLQRHFAARGASLPFVYDAGSGEFRATDLDFLRFIQFASNVRGERAPAREFERRVAERVAGRVTGEVHRVGWPREVNQRSLQFNEHLRTRFGFAQSVAIGRDKDGGFDILWLLPLGALPHKAIVSVQCKNGRYNKEEAHRSVAAGAESFGQHGRLNPSIHVPCVLFNDYIESEMLSPKAMIFVPLGITDLAALSVAAVAPVFT